MQINIRKFHLIARKAIAVECGKCAAQLQLFERKEETRAQWKTRTETFYASIINGYFNA